MTNISTLQLSPSLYISLCLSPCASLYSPFVFICVTSQNFFVLRCLFYFFSSRHADQYVSIFIRLVSWFGQGSIIAMCDLKVFRQCEWVSSRSSGNVNLSGTWQCFVHPTTSCLSTSLFCLLWRSICRLVLPAWLWFDIPRLYKRNSGGEVESNAIVMAEFGWRHPRTYLVWPNSNHEMTQMYYRSGMHKKQLWPKSSCMADSFNGIKLGECTGVSMYAFFPSQCFRGSVFKPLR